VTTSPNKRAGRYPLATVHQRHAKKSVVSMTVLFGAAIMIKSTTIPGLARSFGQACRCVPRVALDARGLVVTPGGWTERAQPSQRIEVAIVSKIAAQSLADQRRSDADEPSGVLMRVTRRRPFRPAWTPMALIAALLVSPSARSRVFRGRESAGRGEPACRSRA
jgi:hypothetical protein